MAASKALVKVSQQSEEDDFEWTDERTRCLDMLLRGIRKVQIAKELNVHPNTITNWTKHPSFVKRLADEMNEFSSAARLRRIRTTTIINDKVTNLALDSLKNAEKKPLSHKAQALAKGWLGEFRSLRNEERLNFGESTNNRNVNTNMHHTGHVTTGARSFKEWMQEHHAAGVIDAEIVGSKTNGQEALVEAVQQVLTEGEFLAETDAAGRAKETEERDKQRP